MEQTAITPEKKPHRIYSVQDVIFAWVIYVAAFLFCHHFPLSEQNLGATLYVGILFIFTTVILLTKGAKITLIPILVFLSAITISAGFCLSSNEVLHFFGFVYCIGAYCYYITSLMGIVTKKGFNDLVVIDWFKAFFVMPFLSMEHFELFHGLFGKIKKKRSGIVLKMLLGFALTFIPTGIVLLLLSYDSGFVAMIKTIFKFNAFSPFTMIFQLILAIPIAMCLYGIYISSVDGKSTKMLTAETCQTINGKIKILPASTVVAAAVPLIAVYVLFFISQWQYYVSGFIGKLPKDFIYSEYAREGFFQLCAVSVINLLVVMVISAFGKRTNGSGIANKTVNLILSVFTLVLIATAASKMVMYIANKGLTPKRVYASWFMAVLALVFIVIAIRQFVPRFQWVTLSLCIVVAAFAVLSVSNVDGLIAKYNVDRYIDGSLNKIDVSYMADLSDAAVPHMVRLAKHLDEENSTDITKLDYQELSLRTDVYGELARELYDIAKHKQNEKTTVWSFNLNGVRARNSLQKIGLIE